MTVWGLLRDVVTALNHPIPISDRIARSRGKFSESTKTDFRGGFFLCYA